MLNKKLNEITKRKTGVRPLTIGGMYAKVACTFCNELTPPAANS